jgi:phenylacetic acid degradation protein
MVGMNAVIMDYANIGEDSIVAAAAFVKARFECPPRSLIVGSPGQVKRTLTDDEVAWKSKGTREYQALTQRCMATLREVAPLTSCEPDRPRFTASDYRLKDEGRSGS